MPIRPVSVSFFSLTDLAEQAGVTPSFNEQHGIVTAAHVAVKAVRDQAGNQNINPFSSQYSSYIEMNAAGEITSLFGNELNTSKDLVASSISGVAYISKQIGEVADAEAVYDPFKCIAKADGLILISKYTTSAKSAIYSYINYYDAFVKVADANGAVSLTHSQNLR